MVLIVMLVILAVTAGVCLIPTPRRAFAPGITVLGGAALLALATHVALTAAAGSKVVAIGNWVSCDGFGALILLLMSYVGLGTSIFSWGHMKQPDGADGALRLRRYYCLHNLFLLAMLAVVTLAQISLVWIALEFTTLASVFLVSFDKTPKAFEAAWKYAILTIMGAILALFGILLLYWGMHQAGGGLFTWDGLAAEMPKMPAGILKTAFILILVGLGSKAGMVPLHSWLPDAYSQAPVPVCVLLSFVETATIPYVIFRLWPGFAGPVGTCTGSWLVFFGLVSAGVAAFLLIQVKELKRLFAFSTIEHLGIILVAAGLGGAAAASSAAYQMVTHIITKSFCFFAVGAALLVIKNQRIESMQGLVRSFPLAGVALLLGALAVSGAPPFAVFLSEFSVLRVGLSQSQYLAVGLLVLFVGISFCAIMFHHSRMVFGRPLVPANRPAVPVSYLAPLLLTALPMALLWIYMPGALADLLRLAGALLGR
jgi:hydrogenase-4 component F